MVISQQTDPKWEMVTAWAQQIGACVIPVNYCPGGDKTWLERLREAIRRIKDSPEGFSTPWAKIVQLSRNSVEIEAAPK